MRRECGKNLHARSRLALPVTQSFLNSSETEVSAKESNHSYPLIKEREEPLLKFHQLSGPLRHDPLPPPQPHIHPGCQHQDGAAGDEFGLGGDIHEAHAFQDRDHEQ